MLADLKYALRFLRRNPGFAAIAIATLAFGIGANTAVFSMADVLLLHSLPYPDSSRLAAIETLRSSQPELSDFTSAPNFADLRARQHSFSKVAAISPVWNLVMTGRGPAQQLDTLYVSGDFFSVLDVKPAAGRLFGTREDRITQADPVAVISYSFWQQQFQGSPNAIGSVLQLGGPAVTIIGVLPANFRYTGEPLAGTAVEPALWLPLGANPIASSTTDVRTVRFLKVIGRQRPGITLERARADVQTIGRSLETEFPAADRGFTISARPLSDVASGKIRGPILLLGGAVAFVLLIACANVSGLMLARAAARSGEMHVRVALGASRSRLLRQLLCEGLLCAIAGGIGGVLLANIALHAAASTAPADLSALHSVDLNWQAMAFMAVAVIAATVLSSIPAGLRVASSEIAAGFTGRSVVGGHSRLRSVLVAAEFAAALVLLTGAALLVRSFQAVLSVNPGFDARNVVTISTQTPPEAQTPAARTAIYQEIRKRLLAVSGVQDVAAVSRLPLMGSNLGATLYREGVPDVTPGFEVEYRVATPNYFQTMRIPLLAGRPLNDHDNDRAHAACLIGETMARRFFGGQNAIGKRIKLAATNPASQPWVTIVGIVGDVRHFAVESAAPPEVYMPYPINPLSAPILTVRTAADPRPLIPALRAAVQSVGSAIPAYNIFLMQELVDRSTAERRFIMWIMGIFAAGALLLAAVGIYGVVAQAVAQRTREIGLRIALGASYADTLRLVFAGAARPVGAGITAGALLALLLARSMRQLLFEVQPADPAAFATAVLLLIAITALACYIPARRATRVDPLTALRQE